MTRGYRGRFGKAEGEDLPLHKLLSLYLWHGVGGFEFIFHPAGSSVGKAASSFWRNDGEGSSGMLINVHKYALVCFSLECAYNDSTLLHKVRQGHWDLRSTLHRVNNHLSGDWGLPIVKIQGWGTYNRQNKRVCICFGGETSTKGIVFLVKRMQILRRMQNFENNKNK